MGAEFSTKANWQTYRHDEANSAFRNFADAPARLEFAKTCNSIKHHSPAHLKRFEYSNHLLTPKAHSEHSVLYEKFN